MMQIKHKQQLYIQTNECNGPISTKRSRKRSCTCTIYRTRQWNHFRWNIRSVTMTLLLLLVPFHHRTDLVSGFLIAKSNSKTKAFQKMISSSSSSSSSSSIPSQSSKNDTDNKLESTSKQTQTILPKMDNRPHEQRVKQQRKARRLNHSFMHLYRHDSPLFDDQKIAPSSKTMTCAKTYLMEYGSFGGVGGDGSDTNTKLDDNNTHNSVVTEQMIEQMSQEFPPLLELDVKRHLRPKMRFLKYTLDCAAIHTTSTKTSSTHTTIQDLTSIPPQYFGARLEKVIAPRHAFLLSKGLPHGKILLENNAALFKEFLISCRRSKSFCALCNQWKAKYGTEKYRDLQYELITEEDVDSGHYGGDQSNVEDECGSSITPKEVDAFDALFTRGIMAAARGDMDPQNQYLKHCNITSGQMIYLLTKHGANPFETDVRDISLVHWAAGSGQLGALKALIRARNDGGIEKTVHMKAERDGATILHWAAAGAKAKEFGCGGHINICRYLMDNCGGPSTQKEIVNTVTKDGNSVLMWAAWSGSLDIVKLMIRHRADPLIQNRNGCTVAHWSASAGIVEICKYLHNTIKVDFDVKNKNGNSPLSHAVAYGRADVVKWLREEVMVHDDNGDAKDLALDFVGWENDNSERKKVLDLFTNYF